MNLHDLFAPVAVAALVGIGTMTVDNARENAKQDVSIAQSNDAVSRLEPKIDKLTEELQESRIEMAALSAVLNKELPQK